MTHNLSFPLILKQSQLYGTQHKNPLLMCQCFPILPRLSERSLILHKRANMGQHPRPKPYISAQCQCTHQLLKICNGFQSKLLSSLLLSKLKFVRKSLRAVLHLMMPKIRNELYHLSTQSQEECHHEYSIGIPSHCCDLRAIFAKLLPTQNLAF